GLKNIFRAGVIEHVRDRNETIIEWRGLRVRAPLNARFPAGAQVTWAVSQGQLVLLGRADAIVGNQANVAIGVVVQFVRLGSNAAIAVAVGGTDRPPLFMSVPLHVAISHGIEA